MTRTEDLHAGGAAGTWIIGGGEMGARFRAFDWSSTPLGPLDAWPSHLRSAVSICLGSTYPIVIYWGADYITLYNDAWIPIPGAKHPSALGLSGRALWSEIWDVIGPMLEGVRATGEAVRVDDQQLFMQRYGYVEECYFTYAFSPIRDDHGVVDGVIAPVVETTAGVLGARRLRLLRDLATHALECETDNEAYDTIARILSANGSDVPFSLLYVLDRDGSRATLVRSTGFGGAAPPAPAVVELAPASSTTDTHSGPWPVAEVIRSGTTRVLDELPTRGAPLPGGPWSEGARSAIVLPIVSSGQAAPTGVLVAGVSPRRALDDDYRAFFDVLAGNIATALTTASGREEERRRAQALAELDRAKTAFFSNVSHEFRTPLTLMLGPLEDVLAAPAGPVITADRELLTVVHRNGLRLLRLVNTLLDFSRIEAGRVEAVYEPVNLAELTADLASVFRSAIERAGLKLVVDCPTLSEAVHVDRDMWEKIVLNLLSNAFKFTFAGEITVALRAAGERAELVVRDTGTGIAPEELPHIFERFHRVRGAHGRTHEGTGIGLALVQELVRLHGGAVGVSSELGLGTTFTVTIPLGTAHLPSDRIGATRTLTSTALSAAPYVEEALRWLPADITPDLIPPSAAPVSTQGARVLLVDDNADMRDYVRRLLSQHWTVEAVADGQAALDAARARRPDLVLTDVMMPRLDGVGLLRALRTDPETRSVPVILVSARAGEESRIEGLEAGADDYLVKPFSARELMARVNAHLELARVRHELMSREQMARREAEQANRAKDEFLAVVSHELRTPLNSILGWAVMLKGGRADPTTAARALDVIERSARVQSQLIEDLLDVSRIITGKLRLDVRPVDLPAVVNAAIDAARPAANAKEIRLQVILDPNAGPIAGDPERLQQVLWNLLSNAVKFTPRRGRVQVRLERVNSHIEVVLSDTGVGIAPEVLPYVFDRFRQGDSTSSRRHGGLGLGLALVKHLVELHGGAVQAESAGVDCGATFTVKLPLMARTAPEVPTRAHPTARRLESPVGISAIAGLRLLVVDDEADTVELFRRLFTEHGAEVTAADSAAAALDQLARAVPDVLICDIEMPDEDGYSLIRRVRSLPPQKGGTVPAIAVTAYGSVDDRIRVLAAGFQMHVPKPVEPAELITVVASVAGRTPR